MALAIARQIFHRDVDVSLMPPDKQLSFDKRKGQKAQKTKQHHDTVVLLRQQNGHGRDEVFSFSDYTARVTPTSLPNDVDNATVKAKGNHVAMTVHADSSKKRFATMKIEVNTAGQLTLFQPDLEVVDAIIDVTLYGEQPHCIQTMWNAIDDLVIRSSSFHSLFELYGHFTEPHPIFSIVKFDTYSDHPIAKFAKHVSNFNNCSRQFKKSHLTRMFGDAFGTHDFLELTEILRGYRFDIRCFEINIAMPRDVYMVSYPFTLPHRRQMNFSVRKSG
jgi:DNA (cytosine-5)-methyltransferase 1